MCLGPPAPDDSMQRSNASAMPKPPVPKCDNMNKISEEMDNFRNTQASTRRTTNEYLMLCLIGFGTIDRRDALMRVISWALEPLLLYSAYIKDLSTQEFEAVMITKKLVSAAAVEEWLGLFNMGLCCIQFDAYMQPDMVTCISRIHHTGKHWFGSFKAKSSARVRRDFYKEHMKELKAKEQRQLLELTGLTLTTRNMLILHDRVGSLQVEIRRLERQLAERREALPEGAALENVQALEQDSATVSMVSRFASNAVRVNLARAYGQLASLNNLNAQDHQRSLPDLSVEIPPPPPVTVDLTSEPDAAPNPPPNPPPHAFAYVARPPPTGNVTVYVMRE